MSLYSAHYSAQDDRSPTHGPYHRHDLPARDRGRVSSWVSFEEGNALGLHHDHPLMAPAPPPPGFKSELVDQHSSFPPPMLSASSSSSSGGSHLPSPGPADYPVNGYGGGAGQKSYFPLSYAAYPPPTPHGFQYGAYYHGQRGPTAPAHRLSSLPPAAMDFPQHQRLLSTSQPGDYPHPFVGAPAWQGMSDRAALVTPSERVYAGLPAQPSPAVVQPDALSPSGEMTLSPAQDLHVQLPSHLHFLSLQPGQQHPAQQAGPSYFAPQPGGYLHQPMPSRAFAPPPPAFYDVKKEQFGLGISTVNAFGRSSPPPPPDFMHSRRPSSATSTSDGSACNLSHFGSIDYSPRLPTFIKPLPECPESPPPASSPPPVLRRIVALPLAGREQEGAGAARSSAEAVPSSRDAGASTKAGNMGKRTHSCEGCRRSKNKCDATVPAKGSGPAASGCKTCSKKGILCEFLPLHKRGMSRKNPLRIYMESQQRKLLRRQSSHAGQLSTRRTLAAAAAGGEPSPVGGQSPSLASSTASAAGRSGSAYDCPAPYELVPAAGQDGAPAPAPTLKKTSSLRSSAPRRVSTAPSAFPYPPNPRRESMP